MTTESLSMSTAATYVNDTDLLQGLAPSTCRSIEQNVIYQYNHASLATL